MLNAIFLSDLHLTTLSDQSGQTFLRQLQSWQGPSSTREESSSVDESNLKPSSKNISHLFLVGDIFDLWLADHDYFLKNYHLVIEQIRRLKAEGVEIHYFEGNHDLYLKTFWQKSLGIEVHSEPANFQLGKFQVRVEHGDQMDPGDHGYHFLRWLLRTKLMVGLAHSLPSWLVVQLGRRMSKSSRKYTSKVKTISPEGAIKKIRRHAELIAQKENYDILVHGHFHVKDEYQFQSGKLRRSINLGSWLGEQTEYLQITDDKVGFNTATRISRGPRPEP